MQIAETLIANSEKLINISQTIQNMRKFCGVYCVIPTRHLGTVGRKLWKIKVIFNMYFLFWWVFTRA